MSDVDLLSFEDALNKSKQRRHVLLGNGFSIACRPQIFSYNRLFDRADWSSLSDAGRQAFELLGTRDFEQVMDALRNASKLLSAYSGSGNLPTQLEQDADALRDILADTIAKSHPDIPSAISDKSYTACREFLVNFDLKFTFNYDLLLYWAVMQDGKPVVQSDDGFRHPHSGSNNRYVAWEPDFATHQKIYYLHGALFLFDEGTEVQKYKWSPTTGKTIGDQVRDALNNNRYPLFVAEGTSDEKLRRIRHSDYLARGRAEFSRLSGSLFIHGHSLSANDDHYLSMISRSYIDSLFVSLYDYPKNPNAEKIARARKIKAQTSNLDLYFYSSESVQVWG